jgi:hypothetical protein
MNGEYGKVSVGGHEYLAETPRALVLLQLARSREEGGEDGWIDSVLKALDENKRHEAEMDRLLGDGPGSWEDQMYDEYERQGG